MTLANCKRCGVLFTRISSDICQKCYREEEEQIQVVRTFLRRNPDASFAEILKNIDIDHTLLEKWVAENRVPLSENQEPEPCCKECGHPVSIGESLCRSCLYKKISSPKKEILFDSGVGKKGMYTKHSR